jgi:hypothetical protein
MSDEIAEEISNKLSALIALLLTPEPHKGNTAEKVMMLARFGIPNQAIADIVGTTKGTVEVAKSRGTKKKR